MRAASAEALKWHLLKVVEAGALNAPDRIVVEDKAERKGRETQVVRQLEELLLNPSEQTPEQRELIEREVKFFVKHREHLHYQAMEKAGAPRSSGAVESPGKQLQHRLRGCGQIWSRQGFTRLLKVVVLLKNQDHHLLWN